MSQDRHSKLKGKRGNKEKVKAESENGPAFFTISVPVWHFINIL